MGTWEVCVFVYVWEGEAGYGPGRYVCVGTCVRVCGCAVLCVSV